MEWGIEGLGCVREMGCVRQVQAKKSMYPRPQSRLSASSTAVAAFTILDRCRGLIKHPRPQSRVLVVAFTCIIRKLAGKSEAQANAMAHAVVGIMWWTAVGIMDDFQKTAVADRFEKDRSRGF